MQLQNDKVGGLTVPEVAQDLGISVRSTWTLINGRKLPSIRIPGVGKKPMVRVDPVDLRAFKAAHRTKVKP